MSISTRLDALERQRPSGATLFNKRHYVGAVRAEHNCTIHQWCHVRLDPSGSVLRRLIIHTNGEPE
jgi:hypothetical protein